MMQWITALWLGCCGLAVANPPPSACSFPLRGGSTVCDPLGLRTNIGREFGTTTTKVSVGYDAIGQLTSWNAWESGVPARSQEQK